MPRLTTALIAVQPQFVEPNELVAEFFTDDRGNTSTDVYSTKVCKVGDREYRFYAGHMYGHNTVEEFIAQDKRLGNTMIMVSEMVLIEHIGAVSQFASENFYNQTVEVSF